MKSREVRAIANNKYIKDHINPVLSELVESVLTDKPKDVLHHMAVWIQKKKDQKVKPKEIESNQVVRKDLAESSIKQNGVSMEKELDAKKNHQLLDNNNNISNKASHKPENQTKMKPAVNEPDTIQVGVCYIEK